MSAPVAAPRLSQAQVSVACRDEVAALGVAVRIPVFTVVTLGLGFGAHVLADGAVPSVGRLVVLAVGVAWSWGMVARREQSLARLTALLWALQAVMHVAMMSGRCGSAAGPSGAAGVAGSTSTAGMAMPMPMHGHGAGGGQVVASCAAMAHAGMTWPSGWMWLSHAVAGLLVAVWLRRGEVAAWRAVRRFLPRLPAVSRVLPVCRRSGCVFRPVAELHASVLVLVGDPRRGPPLLIG
jgi:hypothetical protein